MELLLTTLRKGNCASGLGPVGLLVALTILPVVLVEMPAMIDYPNHLARMYLLAASGTPGWAVKPALTALMPSRSSDSSGTPSRAAISVLQIAWAIGERIVFPWHTKTKSRCKASNRLDRIRWHARVLIIIQTSADVSSPTGSSDRGPR